MREEIRIAKEICDEMGIEYELEKGFSTVCGKEIRNCDFSSFFNELDEQIIQTLMDNVYSYQTQTINIQSTKSMHDYYNGHFKCDETLIFNSFDADAQFSSENLNIAA